MSFFSKLVRPCRKGEKNFQRGRAAEQRSDFVKAKQYFTEGAAAFDEHLAEINAKNERPRPSHMVMAGICYTRTGRYADALRILDDCIEAKDIPDAFLNAGYAAAKSGQAERAVAYWRDYPAWAGQRIIAGVLKELVRAIRSSDSPDLQGACEAVANAVFEQDKANARDRKFRENGKTTSEFRQGY
ncbi:MULTISPECIES: hypothetical protein [unclassified Pseudodesulfovibrio]|uniref:hypothetical protein n=1 Tax=unclassified Pseudodesulfovibrio TaxID=2661612 RepID=UPI000FEB93D4|nr:MULTISPECIES: hypothetical protein [unclassified Pseudodesulfovibrio]MCJ2164343.1 hypothetical protein [Pseudodesulfovibrio sp. S3-i]RWU04553.1 hypothetical protein DWB63_07290 [Pseudodesulfovibrio sp. S3]